MNETTEIVSVKLKCGKILTIYRQEYVNEFTEGVGMYRYNSLHSDYCDCIIDCLKEIRSQHEIKGYEFHNQEYKRFHENQLLNIFEIKDPKSFREAQKLSI